MSGVSSWVYGMRERDTEAISLPSLFGLGDSCSIAATAFDHMDMVPGSGIGSGSGSGIGMGIGIVMNQKGSSKPPHHHQQRQQTQNMHMQQWSSWELEMRRDMHGEEEEQQVPHGYTQQQQQREYEHEKQPPSQKLYTHQPMMWKHSPRPLHGTTQATVEMHPDNHPASMHHYQNNTTNSVSALGKNTANAIDDNTTTFDICDESIVPDIFAAIPEFNVPVFKEEESKAISEVSKRMSSGVGNGVVKEEAQPFEAPSSAHARARLPRATQAASPSAPIEQVADKHKQPYNIYKRRRAVAMQRLAEKRKRFQLNRANASAVRYNVRKRIADRRPRVNGRFVSTVSGTGCGSGSGSEAENDIVCDDVMFWAE